jgi:DNA-binding transcriptional ArsR family regulator
MKNSQKILLSAQAIELVAARFKVLSEPVRINILQTLHHGQASVNEITSTVGSTQPNISKHLKILQDSGFVARRQEGNTVYYSLADETVFALCDLVCASLKSKLAEQAAVLS